MKEKNQSVILRRVELPSYRERLELWMAIGIAFFLWATLKVDLVLKSGLTPSIATAIFLVGGFLGIELPRLAIERLRRDQDIWTISPKAITYGTRKDGTLHEHFRIAFHDIAEVRFRSIDRHLDRGIRVIDKDKMSIFIPQLTDRYLEAQQVLHQIEWQLNSNKSSREKP